MSAALALALGGLSGCVLVLGDFQKGTGGSATSASVTGSVVATATTGAAMGCSTPADCPPMTGTCLVPTCIANACGTAPAPIGTACSAGVCTANGMCVPAGCVNGKQDGLETDIDCGGGACPACVDGKKCVQPSDCATTCTAGVCGCPAGDTWCAPSCVNVKTSAANCGACGHSCVDPSSSCSNGVCQPVVVASVPGVCSMTGDATKLYLSVSAPVASAGIYSMPKAGGAPTPIVMTATPCQLAVDATNVYWEAGTTLNAHPLTAVGVTTQLAVGSAIFGVAVDNTYVYWADQTANTLSKVLKTGGGLTPLAAMQPTAHRIALDATRVFWVNDNPAGEVRSVLKTGGPTTLIASDNMPNHPVVDATSVYWIMATGLMKAAKDGTGLTTLSPANPNSSFLAVDATYVYWFNAAVLTRTPVGGGTSDIISAGQQPNALVDDATFLYWFDVTSSTVRKVAK